MMTPWWRVIWCAVTWGVLSGCGAASFETVGAIQALDVHIAVRSDGGLEVEERLTLSPEGTTTRVRRLVTTPYADDLVFRSATVDGQAVESGEAGLTIDSPDSGSLAAVVDRTASEASIEVSLDYAVRAAVAVRLPRGRLAWQVLESGRDSDVTNVTVTLDVPDGGPIYDGTGMVESGWDVAIADGRVVARRDLVPADEAATLLAVFDIDRSRIQQGAWEWDLDRQQQFGLALVAAGVFILVVGVGILVQLRVQYPPVARAMTDASPPDSDPDRPMLGRGLRLTAVVLLAVAGTLTAVGRWWLAGLGPALLAIPGSMVAVALLFVWASRWYRQS